MNKLEIEALKLYKQPFEYSLGYIHDRAGNTFADQGCCDELENAVIARIRGWGRLKYLEQFDTRELQDTLGRHCAAALNEYWEKHLGKGSIKEHEYHDE